MTNSDFEYLTEQYEPETDSDHVRPIRRRYTDRKRPEYFKKRVPVRRSANLRSNFRRVR